MTVLGDHNVAIGDEGFYAQQCKSTNAFQEDNWDTLVIERGLPRVYPGDILPRIMTFTITDNLNREKFIEKMQKLKGIQKFTSVEIGSFNGLIKFVNWDFPDSKPETTTLELQVTEVGK